MKRFFSIFAFVSLCTACGPQDSTGVGNPGFTSEEQALFDDGDDSKSASDHASALVTLATKTMSGMSLTSSAAAATEAAKVSKLFLPLGCATGTPSGDVLLLHLDNCQLGPSGLTKLNGDLTATYASTPTSVDITVKTSSGFTAERVNRKGDLVLANVRLDTKLTWQLVDATKSTLSWSGTYEAVAEGVTLDHSAAFDVTIDKSGADTCFAVAGNSNTTFNGTNGVTTTISNYRRCGNARTCPEAGSMLSFERASDHATLSVEFLGDATARVTTPKHTLVIATKCTPR